MKMLRTLFIFMFLINLTACGFHPRGEIPLAPPLHNMYLQSNDPYGQLVRNIKQYLKLSGVHFTHYPEQASVILEIINEETRQQLLSVSGTQQTRQYNLILTVNYRLTYPDGTPILCPQSVTETRTIPIQTNQILAGSNEANNLYRQMRLAIAYDIVNRLASNEVSCLVMNHS